MPAHDVTAADWTAVGWEKGYGVVPERIVLDLPHYDGEVSVLAAWDVDHWWIVSAHCDGVEISLTQGERDLVSDELDAQHAREMREC